MIDVVRYSSLPQLHGKTRSDNGLDAKGPIYIGTSASELMRSPAPIYLR